jgi:HlyD family secretion protein
MRLLRDIWSVLTPSQRRRALAAQAISVAMACSTVFGIAAITPFFAVLANPQVIEHQPILHALYVNTGFSDHRGFAAALGVGFVAIVLLANLVNAFGALAIERLAVRIGNELQNTLFEEYLARPYDFHARTNSATLGSNLVNEVSRLNNGILQGTFVLITQAFIGSFIILSIFLVDPVVAIAMLALLGGGYGLPYLAVHQRLLRLGGAYSRAWSDRTRILNECFGAIREMLLLPDSSVFREHFARESATVSETAAHLRAIGRLPRYAMECVAAAALVGIALLLSARSRGTGTWLGELTFVAFAALRLVPVLQQIFVSAVGIRADSAGFALIAPDLRRARAAQMAASAARHRAVGAGAARRPATAICLEDVSYRYVADGPLALEGIDMRIPARTVAGIVGPNGAGKTTLMDVIAGLLVPTAGVLRIDGVASSDGNRREWQAEIAYVPQNVFLLDASIARNIAFGVAPDAIDRDRLAESASLARLSDLVATLPDGFDHIVGERGVRLSGGQRQRIGIARALYRQAGTLLLDEATGALDVSAESELIQTLGQLRGRCTVILITHHASLLRACDTIFQLQNGRLCGSGAYEDLHRRAGASAERVSAWRESAAQP